MSTEKNEIRKLIHFDNIKRALEKLRGPVPDRTSVEEREWEVDSIDTVFADGIDEPESLELRDKAEDFFLDLCLAKEVDENLLEDEVNRFFLAAYDRNAAFKEGIEDFLIIHGNHIYRNILEGREVLGEIINKQLYVIPESIHPIYFELKGFLNHLDEGPYKSAVIIIVSYISLFFHETNTMIGPLAGKKISEAVTVLNELEEEIEIRNGMDKYLRKAFEEDKLYQEKMEEAWAAAEKTREGKRPGNLIKICGDVLGSLKRHFSLPFEPRGEVLNFPGVPLGDEVEEEIGENAEMYLTMMGVSEESAKILSDMYKKHC